MKTIVTTNGKAVLVDDEDYEWLSAYSWSAFRDRNMVYAVSFQWESKDIFMHRLILQTPDGLLTDHIDRNGLNNCRSNLRTATPSQNRANTARVFGLSRFRGVSKHRRKWRARITIDGQVTRLGTFVSEEDAARAWDKEALKAWGDFAVLNFPRLRSSEAPA